MLIQLLKEIENSNGVIRISELSKKLDADPAVVEGMLEHWVRKGRIQRSGDYLSACKPNACSQCCHSCNPNVL